MNKNITGNTTTRDMELPYKIDAGLGSRVHIGLIALSNDQTISYEVRKMLTIPGVAVYESRQKVMAVPQGSRLLTLDALSDLKDTGIESAAELINARRQPDVVAYGCTSGAMVMGEEALSGIIREVLPNTKVTNPLTGVLAALKALQSKSVAIISPYPESVSNDMVNCLKAHGYEVPIVGRFHMDGMNQSADSPFITPQSIENAVLGIGSDNSIDTVFISCTQMRFAEMIDKVEQKLGKPVISSNQALSWHALRLAGCQDKLDGWGSLFKLDIADIG